MKKQTLFKAFIGIGLALQVLGLNPSWLNQCYAQKVRTTAVGPKRPEWVALGGQLQLGLSVLTEGSSITVYGVGSDSARWTIESKDKGKTWGAWTSHGGTLLSAPACDREYHLGEAGVRCFWISANGFVWSQYQRDGAGDAEFVGGISGMKATGDPSVVGGHVFVHNANDNALWAASTQAGELKSDWTLMGGQLKGRPACAQVGENPPPFFGASPTPRITCYVMGTDDAVWVESEVESPNPSGNKAIHQYDFVWTKVGGQGIGGVNVFKYPAMTLAVRGLDSTLWLGRTVNSELQWKNYAGKISSVPACQDNYCFAILPDAQLGFLNLN